MITSKTQSNKISAEKILSMFTMNGCSLTLHPLQSQLLTHISASTFQFPDRNQNSQPSHPAPLYTKHIMLASVSHPKFHLKIFIIPKKLFYNNKFENNKFFQVYRQDSSSGNNLAVYGTVGVACSIYNGALPSP